MTSLARLPTHDDDGHLRVVVESPRGSRAKLAFDPATRVFVLKHVLPRGAVYPYDWGFVPSTRAADGDPLDAMVIFAGATWPGAVIPSTPIGAVRVVQRETAKARWVRNDRVIVVPADAPGLANVSELPRRARRALERFFVRTGRLSHESVKVEGWDGPAEAGRLVQAARRVGRR